MCWLTNAWPSTTSVMVFFRSAPSASTGRSQGSVATAAGSIAACAPQNDRAETLRREQRNRPPGGRWAAPNQECVRNAGKTLQRVFILIGDRLARAVGAGHDQSFRSAGREEQVMQGRVGEHHAQFVVVRGHPDQFHFRGREHDRAEPGK